MSEGVPRPPDEATPESEHQTFSSAWVAMNANPGGKHL